MRHSFLLASLLCLSLSLAAQKTLRFQPEIDASTPPWALLMYAQNPDVDAVDAAYKAWYAQNDFVKTTHTQYYKKWRRSVEKPTLALQLEQEKAWLEQRAGTQRNNAPQWKHLGPNETFSTNPGQVKVSWQANVYCIDQAPSNPNTLYCGTEAGGVYKTTDKGLNWQHASVNAPLRAVHSIRIDPGDENVVYAGDGARIYKTLDGGENWTMLLTASGLGVNDIAVNPANPAIVLAACDAGLFYSSDAGANWTQLFTQTCYDLEWKPGDPSVAYLLKNNPSAKRSEFFKSEDYGATFTIRENGWYNSSDPERADYGARMTVTPADPGRIYAVLIGNSKPGDNGFIGVYRSGDAGESWTLPNPPVGGPWTASHPNLATITNTNDYHQGFYNLSIAASHTNPDRVLIGALNLWKTENGAQSFTPLGGYQGNSSWIHPDQQEIIIRGNDMWVASDGGVNYSTNLFSSHESRKNGITASDFWGFGSGWNEDLIVGGRYHNGNSAARNTFPAGQFLRLGGAEAPTGYVNPGIEGKAYFSDISTQIIPQGIDQQVLSLPALSDYPGESYFAAHSSELEFDPLCYRHIFIGKDNQLWRSENEGASFELFKSFDGNTGPVMHFEISRSNPLVMYVYQRTSFYGATLWKTADGGANWQSLSFPAANSQRAGTMSLSPTDENSLWVAFGHQANDGAKVFKTTDGGLTWTNLTTPTLDGHTIHYVFHQGGTDGAVYIGTNFTVFYRDNSMGDWEIHGEGLPAATNSNIIRPFYKEDQLRLATYSHGIWEVDFKAPSAPLAQPMADKRTAYCARDTFYFDDYSLLNHDGASRQWSFPGAQWVSDASARNPKVVYGATGLFDVTLTVTNGLGQSDSKTVSGMIHIAADGCSPDTIPGYALRLQGGSSDYALAPPLNLNTNELTFSAWIKRDGPQEAFSGLIFCRGANTTAGLNFGNNNELRYHWDDNYWGWNSGLVVPDNEWAHVAFVVEPDRATIYLNGIPSANVAAHAVQDFAASLYLGADPNWDERRFKGHMEEVCVWNRALSQDEIRELRHLSKRPQDDPTLIAYYQFNEETGDALDRSGLRHAVLSGGATRMTSTCPVGGGVSVRVQSPEGGSLTFPGTGLEVEFPETGIFPDGELVATRINLQPDHPANGGQPARSYWVVNNYGPNQGFSPLVSAHFEGVGMISSQEAADPDVFVLFQRFENAGGDEWGPSALATSAQAGADGSVTFAQGGEMLYFGQFAISREGEPSSVAAPEELRPYPFAVFPNPARAGQHLRIAARQPEAFVFTLFDASGKRVLETTGAGEAEALLPQTAPGGYFYRILTDGGMYYGKILIVF
jgi:photosystem II stability/assembly factor-like uncharacterized protein